MIWFAWRQQRATLLAAIGVILVGLGYLLYYRFAMMGEVTSTDLWSRSLPDTVASTDGPEFRSVADSVWVHFWGQAQTARTGMVVGAMVIGVCVGASMFAREWEQQTYLVALSQSVSRARWFVTKFAVAAAVVLGGVVLWELAYAWWARSAGNWMLDQYLFRPFYFESQGLALPAYALFALALGASGGLLIRRTVPAIVVAAAVVAGVFAGVSLYLRWHYLPPVMVTVPWHGPRSMDGEAHLMDVGYLSNTGQLIHMGLGKGELWNPCVSVENVASVAASDSYYGCMTQRGLVGFGEMVQPASRFWTFQVMEFGLFLVLSAAVLGVGMWWLRKRLR
ncbi:hypothetical protein F0L68_21305 [Solihabitans fulvus]|uniref:ABC-2 family transporter protein n=1 Tax=Solihabitans fulvus TaxID=1892852 RepID=A0A5B2X8K1_9PSEU|nr:hypothetical protein [Solihabitans fulvus]KAA2259473.1 hypothetical protein F0L68_21305 [Solihabitans fulvus]